MTPEHEQLLSALPDPLSLMDGLGPVHYGVGVPNDTGFLGLLLVTHPEWATVIEFGTYWGLTSLWLGTLLRESGRQLITLDYADGRAPAVKGAWLPNMEFFTQDLLVSPLNQAVSSIIQTRAPCLVIMDNGNKPVEVNRYAPFIQPGSAFCVHDWGKASKGLNHDGEVCLDDIQETLTTCNYQPVLHAEAEEMRSHFRCWAR